MEKVSGLGYFFPALKTPAKPELLAPAGTWEALRAAVENGADAVYFGLSKFNARIRAQNFTAEDLPEIVLFLHGRGVKGYLTFNTLVFANEMANAQQQLKAAIESGIDAAIVQDFGVCRLIRELSPDFPIHASTQMTVTSANGVRIAAELGASRVILARECSVAEIGKIRAELGAGVGVELEVFVHGALCVAYSGQCLTSESLGGRSANRGECAQACRMPYELFKDGVPVPLGDRRYLLSPQDLAGLSMIPQLMAAGVASFKIEGRLKTPEYVAGVTAAYREAIDRAAAGDGVEETQKKHQYDLEMAFSRGLYTGWLNGIDNQKLAHARFGKKRGVFLGEVQWVRPPHVALKLAGPVKPGDGVVFDQGRPDEKEAGGPVHGVEAEGALTLLRFDRQGLPWPRLKAGDKIWKTSDPVLTRRLRKSFSGESPAFRRPVDMEITGASGEPLSLQIQDGQGRRVVVQSAVALESARTQPLTEELLREQLGRLGGTAFYLRELVNRTEGPVMLPKSALNQLRREAVERLEKLWEAPSPWQLRSASPVERISPKPGEAVSLIPLVRTMEQLEAVLGAGASEIYAEFEDPKKYKEAAACTRSAAVLFVAPPRIFKPGEEWIFKLVADSGAEGVLVRNYDHLFHFEGLRKRGDFSLNVSNYLTAGFFMEKYGLERLTASYDLNAGELMALLASAPPAWFEVTLHQHMPMFHMEHCVFCAFLSTGKDYRDCGRPCDRHEVKLKDRTGALHTLKADAGCRNTLFNAKAQTGAEFAGKLLSAGVRAFRVEFLGESAGEVKKILSGYREVLSGERPGASLWREFNLDNQLGVTRGTLAG